MGQDSGSSFPAWFWLRVSHEVVLTLTAGLCSSEGLTGAEGANTKPAHSGQGQLGASVSFHWAFHRAA